MQASLCYLGACLQINKQTKFKKQKHKCHLLITHLTNSPPSFSLFTETHAGMTTTLPQLPQTYQVLRSEKNGKALRFSLPSVSRVHCLSMRDFKPEQGNYSSSMAPPGRKPLPVLSLPDQTRTGHGSPSQAGRRELIKAHCDRLTNLEAIRG